MGASVSSPSCRRPAPTLGIQDHRFRENEMTLSLKGLCLRTLPVAAMLAAAVVVCAPGGEARAQELSVLSGGAAKSGLNEAISRYEAKSGVKVKADFQPLGRLSKSLADC